MGILCGKLENEERDKHPTGHVVHPDGLQENVQDFSVLIGALYRSSHPELFDEQVQERQTVDKRIKPLKSKNSEKVIFTNLQFNVY